MPTYEYHCDACGSDQEVFQSMKADALQTCPECGESGKIHRKISSGAGIIFKGSGFYETDYKPKGDSGESKTSDPKATDAKSDTTKKATPKPDKTPTTDS